MELNEEQINRLLAIIDSKVTQAVATKLSSLIPDSVQQTTTAFEQIFMQGYKVGAPLQQGTFREFLRRCKLDTLTFTGADGITVTRNSSTGAVTISGLTLHTAIALCSTLAFKTISTDNGTSKVASTKDDTVLISGAGGVSTSVNSSGKVVIDASDLKDSMGNLENLKTEDNDSLVDAINEIFDASEDIKTFKSIGDGTNNITATASDDSMTIEGSGYVGVDADTTNKKIDIGLVLGGNSTYGNNDLVLQPAKIPLYSNTLRTCNNYQLYLVEYNSTSRGVSLSDLTQPVTVYIIICKINTDLSRVIWSDYGITFAQNTSLLLESGHNYRLTIYKCKSVSDGTEQKLAFIEEIN